MAKKDLDFGKLTLPQKPIVVKQDDVLQQAEKAVETIHVNPSFMATEKPVEEVKKISLDLPVDVYTYIKMHTFKRRITMREYLLDIIHQDMKRNGE